MTLDRQLLIDKIFYLSERLDNNYYYEILEPWKFDASDFIEIQHAAKKIGDFLGLHNLTFIISKSKQKVNTAGKIELDNKTDVFIEIDSNEHFDEQTILTILSHEICHKYLYIKNIKQPGLENEILTDVAAIYLGLGKLLLNGCKTFYGAVGYLKRTQYAFIYKIICQSRRIPEELMYKNLITEIVKEIGNEKIENIDFFSNEIIMNAINLLFTQTFNEKQKKFAELKKHVIIINKLMDEINSHYKDFHKNLNLNYTNKISEIKKTYQDESSNFIKNYVAYNEAKILWNKESQNEPNNINKLLLEFIEYLNKIFFKNEKISTNPQVIIECPLCNHKMSFNKKIIARIKCKKCSYLFIYNNTDFIINQQEFFETQEKIIENVIDETPKKTKREKNIFNIFKKNK